MERRDKKNNALLYAVGVIVLLAVGLGFYFLYAGNGQTTSQTIRTSSKWQAVFLTNEQVYFGHLTEVGKNELLLKDVYYLQSGGSGQLNDDSKDTQPFLAKLGRFELHCPEDHMNINRAQVLFTEELKADSKVVKAIDLYMKSDDANKPCYAPQS